MRSCLAIILLLVNAAALFGQNKIDAYEYWFDSDTSAITNVSVSPTAVLQLNTLLVTPGLVEGIHRLNIRFHDDSLHWSSVHSKLFYKSSFPSPDSSNIVLYQSWFDSDFANSNTFAVTPGEVVDIITTLPSQNLLEGVHRMHFRTKDDKGQWSSIHTKIFYRVPDSVAGLPSNKITSWQYWFDNDTNSITTTTVSPTSPLDLTVNIPANNIIPGVHRLNIRFRDQQGFWSSVKSQIFYRLPDTSSVPTSQVDNFKYWFDSDAANASTVSVTPGQVVVILDSISFANVNPGIHRINFQFHETDGDWSSVFTKLVYRNPDPTTPATPLVDQMKYWFDDDFPSASTTAITAASPAYIMTNLDASSLLPGVHRVNIQFHESDGEWGSVFTKIFYRLPGDQASGGLVEAFRWWFDMDTNNVNDSILASPVNPFDLNFSPALTHLPKGEHAIRIQFRDTLGQWSSVLTDSAYKNPLPVASFVADTQFLCDSGSVQFSDRSIDADTWLWNFGDGNTDTVQNPMHTYTSPGNYNVSLLVTDTASGLDSTITISAFIKVGTPPSPTLSVNQNDSVCDGAVVTISAVANQLSYLWSTGDSSNSIQSGSSGSFFATITDSAGCVTKSDTFDFTVLPLPVVSAGNDTDVCTGESLTLSGMGAASYSWTGGINDGQSFAVLSTNDYVVTGTDAYNCSNTDTISVTALAVPTVSAGSDDSVCFGDTATLSGNGATNYSWTAGITDGIGFVPDSTSSYVVTGSLVNGCSDQDTVTIVVHALPNVNAGNDLDVCQGDTTTLSGMGANSYQWTGGITDGVAFVPSASSSYILTGTDANNCVNTDTVIVSVNPLPNVDGGNNVIVCLGDTVTLSGTGAISYSWSGGIFDGIGFVPTSTKSYIVVGTDGNNCKENDTVTVTIQPLPSVFGGNDTSICEFDSLVLAGSGAVTYSWSGGISDGVKFSPSATASYVVTGTDSNNCSATDTVSVIVIDGPNINGGSDKEICQGKPVALTATGAVSYSWTNGITNGVSFFPSATQSYIVTGTDSNGCTAKDTVKVTVNPLPAIDAGPDTTVCPNSTVTLSASGGVSYAWNNNVTNGVPFTPATTSSYIVTGVDIKNCVGKDTVIVTVNIPYVTMDEFGDTVCLTTQPIILTGSPVGGSFTGIGVTDSIFDPAVAGLGVHVIYYDAIDSVGCLGTDSVTTFVGTPASAGFGHSINGLIVTFKDSSAGAITWHWDFGDGDTSNLQSPMHSYDTTGDYEVCLVAKGDCNSDTVCDSVAVTSLVGIISVDPLLKVYPNPATNHVRVEWYGQPTELEAEIVGIDGRSYGSYLLESGQANNIPLVGITSGTYVLRLRNESRGFEKSFRIILIAE